MAVSDLTDVDICNMAIGHTGSRAVITGLNDGSDEADACALHYDPTRRKILGIADWPFARQRVVLTATALTRFGWASVYKVPDDALVVRRLSPSVAAIGVAALSNRWGRALRPDQRIPYDIERDPPAPLGTGLGKILLTDFPNPECWYTADLQDVSAFPPGVVDSLALFLGSKLAKILTASVSKSAALYTEYKREILEALAEAFEEGQEDPEPMTKYEAIRLGGVTSDLTGFGSGSD